MCDDCDKRYSENKQLGPKFLVCNCNPEKPRELELEMAKSEIKNSKVEDVDMTAITYSKEEYQELKKNTISYEDIDNKVNEDPFKTKIEQYKDNRRRKKV
jgi:hypothetical protein